MIVVMQSATNVLAVKASASAVKVRMHVASEVRGYTARPLEMKSGDAQCG